MDPTINLVTVKNSFIQTKDDRDKDIIYPPKYIADNREIPIYKYIDATNYPAQIILPDNNEYGPYMPSKIGNSIFMDNDAIKLANIDSVFKFSKHQGGMFGPQELKPFRYIGINVGMGGYHQYLQYRLPLCFGYSISSINTNNINESLLDIRHERFKKIIGNDHTGNIITNVNSMLDEISNIDSNNIDLVVSNMTNNRRNDVVFIAAEFIISLTLLKRNGYWIINLKNIDDPIKDLIYMISLVFDNITIFKPMASHFKQDIYLIAEGPRMNTNIIEILTDIIDAKKHKMYPEKLLSNRSTGFDIYIDNILLYIMNIQNYENILYRHDKALVMWDLPGNLENKNLNPLLYTYGKKRDNASGPIILTLDQLEKDKIYVLKKQDDDKQKQFIEYKQRTQISNIPDIAHPRMLSPRTISPRMQIQQSTITY
uniref:FtsJ-like methyltransferase n=1 Tax=Pithovirus LCPAC102 TaxID=2506587 RepID=A0A481Z2W9_9VIRU|nr:MAG: FtsJ-like methyltransferase [Pithovirus LCPAC102]